MQNIITKCEECVRLKWGPYLNGPSYFFEGACWVTVTNFERL